MDREIDLVSPLVSPLTYEGLIDEILGIADGQVKLDASIIEDEKSAPLMDMSGNIFARYHLPFY
jgi:hypothetical protein